MAVPFIGTYLELGHDVTLACDPGKHHWLTWAFPQLKVIDCICNPYEDYNQTAEGYDVYLNLNRVELLDSISSATGWEVLNQQYSYSIVAALRGLPLPHKGFSPSRYVDYPIAHGGQVMVFTKGSHASRTMAPELAEELRRRAPDAVFDPEYGSLIELSQAIAGAREVIGMDSGAVHIAEMFSTPWRVLHTTMNFKIRHKFYEYGDETSSLQAGLECSPCYDHGGCEDLQCTKSFPVEQLLEARLNEPEEQTRDAFAGVPSDVRPSLWRRAPRGLMKALGRNR